MHKDIANGQPREVKTWWIRWSDALEVRRQEIPDRWTQFWNCRESRISCRPSGRTSSCCWFFVISRSWITWSRSRVRCQLTVDVFLVLSRRRRLRQLTVGDGTRRRRRRWWRWRVGRWWCRVWWWRRRARRWERTPARRQHLAASGSSEMPRRAHLASSWHRRGLQTTNTDSQSSLHVLWHEIHYVANSKVDV